MPCLVCQFFDPTEPPQHRAEREARACGHGCGSLWDHHTAISFVHHHKQDVQGWCLLNPEPLRKQGSAICGQIQPVELNHWFIDQSQYRKTENESLVHWGLRVYRMIKDGSWRSQRAVKFEADNHRLKLQLKEARARSARRLKKLKAVQAKPEAAVIRLELPEAAD